MQFLPRTKDSWVSLHNGFMKGLRERLLSVIDSSAKQAMDLVNDFSDSINSFDWDEQLSYLNEKKNSLIERGNLWLKDFGELLKQVKESFNDFSVTVPFDESIGEKLDFSINGNKLKVVVTYEDETSSRSNETTVIIPANCDVSKVSKTINTVAKSATISIPKVITTNDEMKEKEATAAPKTAKKRVNPKRTATVGKPKIKRAANGRFVKADE